MAKAKTITPKKVIETICQDVCDRIPEFTGFRFHYKKAGLLNFRFFTGATVLSIAYANRLYCCEFMTNLRMDEIDKYQDNLSYIVAESIIRNFEDEYIQSMVVLIRNYIKYTPNRDSAFLIVQNNIRAGYVSTVEKVVEALCKVDANLCSEFLEGLFEFCANDGEIIAQILEIKQRIGLVNADEMEL